MRLMPTASLHPTWAFATAASSNRTPPEALRQVRDRRAVLAVALAAVDERVRRELLSHGLAQGTRSASVNDAHGAQSRKCSVVDEAAYLLARFLARHSAHVELVGRVAARGRTHLNRRRAVLR